MDTRDDERFEARLKALGDAIDHEVGPSDPRLLERLGQDRDARGGRRRERAGRHHRPNRWYYWAAALLIILVTVPYVAHLTHESQPATHQQKQKTVLRGNGSGQPIVIGAAEAVDFVTAQRGWVVVATGAYASRNALFATGDGGRTWSRRMLPKGYTALALHFTGDRQGTGYVLAQETGLGQTGAAGQTVPVAILATPDGGKTWRVAWSEAGPQALANVTVTMRVGFQFFGSQGYAYVGDKILTTESGQSSWSPLTLPQGFAPVHMDFLTQSTGFVAGQVCQTSPQPGTAGGSGCTARLIETRDGGRTWQTVFTAPEQNYWNYSDAVSFASARDGWFFLKDSATWGGYLYQTTDGGQHWVLEQGSQSGPNNFAQGRTVYGPPTFVTSKVGWLPIDEGAAPYPGGLMITRDGGRTWTQTSMNLDWSLNGVSLVSPEVGYAVGGGGTAQQGFLVKTVDGGKSWTQLLPSLTPTALIDFPDATHGFGVGVTSDPEAVLTTRDGGTTWHEIYRAANPVQALSFVGQRVGYMATAAQSGQSLTLLKTTDGGRNWDQTASLPIANGVLLGTNPYLNFRDARRGVMQTSIYPDVAFSATVDGGKTWTVLSSQPATPGTFQQFAYTSQAGYRLLTVPGSSQSQPSTVTLARTIDGGRSYDIIHTWQGSGQGAAVFFLSARVGWVAMQENPYTQNASTIVLATRDGGATWTASSTRMTLQDFSTQLEMQFPTAQDGWLMGLGSLYRTLDGGRTWQQMP